MLCVRAKSPSLVIKTCLYTVVNLHQKVKHAVLHSDRKKASGKKKNTKSLNRSFEFKIPRGEGPFLTGCICSVGGKNHVIKP